MSSVPRRSPRQRRSRVRVGAVILTIFAAATALTIYLSERPRGLAYWQARAARLHPGMSRAECDSLLPVMKKPVSVQVREYLHDLSPEHFAEPTFQPAGDWDGGGGSLFYSYQVDAGVTAEFYFGGTPFGLKEVPNVKATVRRVLSAKKREELRRVVEEVRSKAAKRSIEADSSQR